MANCHIQMHFCVVFQSHSGRVRKKEKKKNKLFRQIMKLVFVRNSQSNIMEFRKKELDTNKNPLIFQSKENGWLSERKMEREQKKINEECERICRVWAYTCIARNIECQSNARPNTVYQATNLSILQRFSSVRLGSALFALLSTHFPFSKLMFFKHIYFQMAY